MTTKLEQAARQIIVDWDSGIHLHEAITAMREALADPKITTPDVCGEVCARAKLCYGCNKDLEEANANYVEQAEQEPMMDYERINALREGEQNGAEDAYFFVRPENDTPTLRKMFCQGFERGFHKGLKYAAPVRTKDLTDDEIWSDGSTIGLSKDGILKFARAVIAKFKEKNK